MYKLLGITRFLHILLRNGHNYFHIYMYKHMKLKHQAQLSTSTVKDLWNTIRANTVLYRFAGCIGVLKTAVFSTPM